MSLYGEYDDFYSVHTPPHILGGKNRTLKADTNGWRDGQGRLMPNDETARACWTLDPHHGQAGGRKRSDTAKRNRGRFAKN